MRQRLLRPLRSFLKRIYRFYNEKNRYGLQFCHIVVSGISEALRGFRYLGLRKSEVPEQDNE